MDAKIKSEGQRRLLDQAGTETELGKKIGCSPSTIGHWRRGSRVPGKAARHKIELLFGIPRAAWGLPTGSPIPEEPPQDKDDGTLEITKRHLAKILHELDDNEDLTEAETAKLNDNVTKLLALRARLERDQELLEDRIVREHPEWQRLKAVILRALKPHPEIAAEVAEALK